MKNKYVVYSKIFGCLAALIFFLENSSLPFALVKLAGVCIAYHLAITFLWKLFLLPKEMANYLYVQIRARLGYWLRQIFIQACLKLPMKLIRCLRRWVCQFLVWLKWQTVHRNYPKFPINW